MKIYTEVVWSWDDEKGELVRESSKSYDYEGPLTLAQHPTEVTGANYNTGASDNFVYPKNTNPGLPHYITFIAKKSYTSTTSTRGQQNGSVVLYMPPDALKTSYTQTIGDIDARANILLHQAKGTGAGSALAGGDFGSAADTISDAIMTGGKGMDMKKMGDMAKTLATAGAAAVVSGLAASGVGQAVSRATGQIMNPHKAVVYQGPGQFRQFSYTFVLVPKSADESKEIFNIVKFFKKRMHPGTGTGAGINDIKSTTLTYPDEFEIQYHVNNKLVDGSDETKPLFKIHNCFMESFATDYTTSSLVSFLDDDQPLTTTISMSFKETQLLTKKDIDAGY